LNPSLKSPTVFQGRGFFGLVKVREETATRKENDVNVTLRYNVLIHGGIDHGRQHLDPARKRLPISYFHPTGGIGQIFEQLDWPDARLPVSLVGQGCAPGLLPAGLLCDLHSEPPFAVIGLGTGTLAGRAKPCQTMHIYEIDPLVRRLSLPGDGTQPLFTYVQDAIDREADLSIIMGDGRLRLREAPAKYYHVIVLDAFSSDAIPIHLLTADAIGEYLAKLADGGVLVFNTTNRYVDLHGVLANIAQHLDLECLTYGDLASYANRPIPDKFSADWVVMRRRHTPGTWSGGPPLAERLAPDRLKSQLRPHYLALNRPELLDRADLFEWRVPPIDPGPVWTDSYSNLLRVIYWRQ
jgi:hypothetical protein